MRGIFLVVFITLISLLFCEAPPKDRMKKEEALLEIRKNILQCLSKQDTSPELKKYVNEVLAKDTNEELRFRHFLNNEHDRRLIRTCKREAFLNNIQKNSPNHRIP